jgi:hypothetical protein
MDPDYGQRRITRSVCAEAGSARMRDIGDVSASRKFPAIFVLSAFSSATRLAAATGHLSNFGRGARAP